MLTLPFETRNTEETLHAVRTGGKVPAVFYGPKEESTSIIVKASEFKKVWKEAGESSIIVLKNGTEEHEALIQEVDVHPVTDIPRHIDFYVIEKGKKLEVEVPLTFVGVSAAVKDLGGTLVKVMHDLPIEALPKDLPHDIQVDISLLTDLNSQILVKDLKLPAGVEAKVDLEEVVAAVTVKAEEVEEVAPADISSIEMSVEKGKKPVEGEDGEAGEAEEKK
jgi:large subunit ribosomal protein L25